MSSGTVEVLCQWLKFIIHAQCAVLFPRECAYQAIFQGSKLTVKSNNCTFHQVQFPNDATGSSTTTTTCAAVVVMSITFTSTISCEY